MVEVTLDDFTKAVRRIVREEVAPLKQRNKELREQGAFYQSAYGNERAEKEKLQEAVYALTTRTRKILSSDLYKKEKASYKTLGFEVLHAFLDILRDWDWEKHPEGLNYDQVAARFPHQLRDTIGRRMRELGLPHKPNCKHNCAYCLFGFEIPPLQHNANKPGFYLPSTIGVSAQ